MNWRLWEMTKMPQHTKQMFASSLSVMLYHTHSEPNWYMHIILKFVFPFASSCWFFFCILVNQCLQSLQSSWRHDQNQNKKRCEQSENYGTQALVVSSCRRMCMVLQHNLIRDYKWTRKCEIDCLCFASHTSLYNPLIVINLMCKHSDLKRKWPMSS